MDVEGDVEGDVGGVAVGDAVGLALRAFVAQGCAGVMANGVCKMSMQLAHAVRRIKI
jgi:hypothetical protein